ncbi:ABC transporter substrate-binding protein [Streptomyces sp. NPDC058683]|uniref:ABC transporter substrate-binding protein n=1 Tax=Streptomyces sp. NPDC058683 TaxID=3346597 RepID=UPI00364FB282
MRQRTGVRTLALTSSALLGAALLTGCADNSTSVGADGKTTVSVGLSGNIFDPSIRVAEENGYFDQHDIKVKYVTLTAATGTSALESGSVQFLNDSPTNVLTAHSKELGEVSVGTNGGGNLLGLVVSDAFAKKHELTADTPADQVAQALADSTAGASSANTKAEAGLYLKAHGVDPAKLKWVSLPSPAADKAALVKGEIDWFVRSEPIPLQVQKAGDGVVVADPLKVPQWAYEDAGYGQVVALKKSWANANADVVKGSPSRSSRRPSTSPPTRRSRPCRRWHRRLCRACPTTYCGAASPRSHGPRVTSSPRPGGTRRWRS